MSSENKVIGYTTQKKSFKTDFYWKGKQYSFNLNLIFGNNCSLRIFTALIHPWPFLNESWEWLDTATPFSSIRNIVFPNIYSFLSLLKMVISQLGE